MKLLKNPLPDLVQAVDAASKVLALQADLLFLNQELKLEKQIKRLVCLVLGLVLLNSLLFFTFFWIGTALHESGWSASSLALAFFLFFGMLLGIVAFLGGRINHGK